MLTIKVEGLEQLTKNLQLTAREIVKVARSTVDTTANAVKNIALDTATINYNITKKRLQETSRGAKTIYVKRSTQSDLSATVTFKGGTGTKSGDRPGLHHYADKDSLKRGKGIYPRVRVKKDSGWKTIKGGFYQTMPNGGVGIFEKLQPIVKHKKTIQGKRGPRTVWIEKVVRRTGPGIKQIVEDKDVNAIVISKSREMLQVKMREAVAKVIAKRQG